MRRRLHERLIALALEIQVGELTLIPFRQLLSRGEALPLRRRPLAILSVLAQAGGALVTKDELIERVWSGAVVEDNAIQAQITALRKALGGHSRLVVTVHGLGYRLDGTAAAPTEAEDSNIPSLAVLPFANLSDDPGQSYFVDGLMEELVTSLTRIRTIMVIASGSTLSLRGQEVSAVDAAQRLSVRYVLEGSVRRAGDDVRIAVRLVDAENGSQIWADRFNDRYEDIFALQDRVALAVAGVIEFTVQGAEMRRSIHRPTKDLRSYDLHLQALALFRTYQQDNMFKALDLLEQAIALDPNFALALSQASSCHAMIARFRWSNDYAGHERAMMALIDQSLQQGGDDPQVLATAAMTFWAHGDLKDAARLAERATDLNPGSSWPWLARAKVAVAVGDIDLADDAMQRSMRLDPLSPNRNLQVGALAAIRFGQHRFEEGLSFAREYVELAHQPLSLGMLAATHGQLGNDDAAAAVFAELRDHSSMPLKDLAAMFFRDEELQSMLLHGLHRAENAAQMKSGSSSKPTVVVR
jgi:TolB-like protein/tetratricopeptide (TPR) repeat protein